jgi:two-component system LytT family response regulator
VIQITEKHPDLLFLDVQMPERSGFDLLESLNDVPEVIFTTAFDEYAVKAFEVNALDYLTKPIREERFAQAMEKVRQKLALQTIEPQIFVKDRQQYHFIKWSKVHLIESMDNYARLYFEEKNVFLKSSLNQLEEKLDAGTFFRINRSQIINLAIYSKHSNRSKWPLADQPENRGGARSLRPAVRKVEKHGPYINLIPTFSKGEGVKKQ